MDFWRLIAFESDAKIRETLDIAHAPRWEDRMRAVAELVDRGFGKAVQELELKHSGGLTIMEQKRIQSFSNAELARFNGATEVIEELLNGGGINRLLNVETQVRVTPASSLHTNYFSGVPLASLTHI